MNKEWFNDIHVGDAREVLEDMPSGLADCVVTSPPYWGLRDYGEEGQLGLEDTPEEYVKRLVDIFKEVKRVLKTSGTLWLNLGDSYFPHDGSRGNKKGGGDTLKGRDNNYQPAPKFNSDCGLKAKDLVGIPWRVAFALQEDGWYLRNDIIWMKPNPMPESVKDRCTSSHEHIFLFSKKKRYWFDQDAIREPHKTDLEKEPPIGGVKHQSNKNATYSGNTPMRISGRNKRDVWKITTKPFAPAHFAVFPPELPRTCIKAGCPPKVCLECGKPYERKIEEEYNEEETVEYLKEMGADSNLQYKGEGKDDESGKAQNPSDLKRRILDSKRKIKRTVGWEKQCDCSTDEVESGVVLDPFIGAGTTGLIAKQLNRNWIGIDIKEEYREMALERIEKGDKYMRKKEREKRKKEKMQKNHKSLVEFMDKVGGFS